MKKVEKTQFATGTTKPNKSEYIAMNLTKKGANLMWRLKRICEHNRTHPTLGEDDSLNSCPNLIVPENHQYTFFWSWTVWLYCLGKRNMQSHQKKQQPNQINHEGNWYYQTPKASYRASRGWKVIIRLKTFSLQCSWP